VNAEIQQREKWTGLFCDRTIGFYGSVVMEGRNGTVDKWSCVERKASEKSEMKSKSLPFSVFSVLSVVQMHFSRSDRVNKIYRIRVSSCSSCKSCLENDSLGT